jgi:hypothetical protein
MKLAQWSIPGALAAALAMASALPALAADGSVTGTLTYKGQSVSLKYVWLVKGPDAFDPKVTLRHLIFSSADIGAKVAACKTMSCTDAALGSGMTIDVGAGPRLNYWVVLNDQRVQYSGTVRPDALKLTADTPTHLAGKLTIDDAAAGGAKVDAAFDTPLLQELKLAR